MKTNTCPLCSLEFEGESCHSACPMSSGCSMIRCPGCGYEYVEESTLLNIFKKLFKGGSGEEPKTVRFFD